MAAIFIYQCWIRVSVVTATQWCIALHHRGYSKGITFPDKWSNIGMMPIQNWIHSHVVRSVWISWRKCTKCIRKGVICLCAQQNRLDWGLSFFQCFQSIFNVPIHSNQIQIVPLSSFRDKFFRLWKWRVVADVESSELLIWWDMFTQWSS